MSELHEQQIERNHLEALKRDEIHMRASDMIDFMKDYRLESRKMLDFCLGEEDAVHLRSFRMGIEAAIRVFDNLLIDHDLKNLVKYN